jgi:nitrile hydratase
MAGVHDIGGKPGFGAVPVDDDVLFHDDWERRAFAVTQFAQGAAGFNTDAFRHGIEREDPETYRSATYFDKWIRNAERMLVEGGVLAPDAVPAALRGDAPAETPRRTTDARPSEGRGTIREIKAAPRFSVGDSVTVATDAASAGHTRLPDYVAGRTGTVAFVNGGWIFPDTHAHGRGEQPTWVYAIAFNASDLWPDDDATHVVYVDLFEPYLDASSHNPQI